MNLVRRPRLLPSSLSRGRKKQTYQSEMFHGQWLKSRVKMLETNCCNKNNAVDGGAGLHECVVSE